MASINEFNYLKPSLTQIDSYWQSFLLERCYAQLITIDKTLTNQVLSGASILPPAPQIFRALYGKPSQIKVVILGQDPYHGPNQANGLAFAVNPGITPPPSLQNIFKEIALEYQIPRPFTLNSSLLQWAKQGVVLLNASLSVLQNAANSHAQIGWHSVTDHIISEISAQAQACAFLLWGNYAKSKKTLISLDKHCVLEAVHPSPLSASRGFFGCGHFKAANQFLAANSITPIDWLAVI
jgi:uracil-DNA glycosylase